MKKGTKAALIVAGCCMGAGIVLGVAGFAMNGGRWMHREIVHLGEEVKGTLEENTFVEKVYEAESDSIDRITIKNKNNGIQIYPSTDGKLRITYYESNKVTYSIDESGNELQMQVRSYKKWYDYLSLGWWDEEESVDMKIEVPEQLAAEMDIKTSNAQINVKDVILKDESEFHSSNGCIQLSNVNGDACVKLKTSNAELILEEVKAKKIEADTSNGDVRLCNMEAEELEADTSNASIALDGTIQSDDIDLETSNGNVEGMITGKESDYDITAKTSNGNSSLPENRSGGTRKLQVKTSNARIDVTFSER